MVIKNTIVNIIGVRVLEKNLLSEKRLASCDIDEDSTVGSWTPFVSEAGKLVS